MRHKGRCFFNQLSAAICNNMFGQHAGHRINGQLENISGVNHIKGSQNVYNQSGLLSRKILVRAHQNELRCFRTSYSVPESFVLVCPGLASIWLSLLHLTNTQRVMVTCKRLSLIEASVRQGNQLQSTPMQLILDTCKHTYKPEQADP